MTAPAAATASSARDSDRRTGHRGARTEGRGAQTRAAILARAVDLASVEGLEGLTIGRLASELGMSKSGLFAHFGSKQELQLATVAAATDRFRAVVVEPAAAEAEGLPRLRALAGRYIDHVEGGAYPGGCFWASTSAEYDDRPGPVRDAIAAAMAAWTGELERQAAIAGLERPAQVAFELYAVGTAANSRYRLSGDGRVFGYAREAVERLLR
ncbi:MAG TPA: TetR/AcrR family transcriptional regulator [Solirubrobacterales bacterium]|jgi:AcrR family transcriptional regulator